jgi:hypothetical protein
MITGSVTVVGDGVTGPVFTSARFRSTQEIIGDVTINPETLSADEINENESSTAFLTTISTNITETSSDRSANGLCPLLYIFLILMTIK